MIPRCPFCSHTDNLIYWKNFDAPIGCEVCKHEVMRKNGMPINNVLDWVDITTRWAYALADKIKTNNKTRGKK